MVFFHLSLSVGMQQFLSSVYEVGPGFESLQVLILCVCIRALFGMVCVFPDSCRWEPSIEDVTSQKSLPHYVALA